MSGDCARELRGGRANLSIGLISKLLLAICLAPLDQIGASAQEVSRRVVVSDQLEENLRQKQLIEPILPPAAAAIKSESQGQQQQQQANITQVFLDKFHYVFQNSSGETGAPAEGQQQQEPANGQSQQQLAISKTKQQLDRLTELFVISSQSSAWSALVGANKSIEAPPVIDSQASPARINYVEPSWPQSNLETRTNQPSAHYAAQQQQRDETNKRNFIRILNRVFSRVELPEAFKRPLASQRTSAGVSANLSVQSTASSSPSGSSAPNHCGNHIGCVAELPNFPIILKLKPNVSASFTIYTRERGPRQGQRIMYEPLMHYQLQDGHRQLSDPELTREFANITRHLKLDKGGSAVAAAALFAASLSSSAAAATSQQTRRQAGGARHKSLTTTSSSWMSSANKIVHSREIPFDLAALEQSGFNASLTTRVIIGGYFAKEDEEWIDELVRQWLLLEPQNVIKVSWQDSNRGLYHSAAYNSRIVGRQLSLFLHYLNELFHIDLAKFHLVGHSLGAHIAGFVGADSEGQIARITGLDPAGPIFVELGGQHRLDPSDAKFVDVVHTNGGTITKGALGLSTPSGHVDYYSNGGSLQPGCFFSSVTMSIMDPVERIACNHRRSYRYFTEIIKLAIREQAGELGRLPRAFLFEAKQEDLVKLVQPDIKLAMNSQPGGAQGAAEGEAAPMRKLIEFHSLDPEFPRSKRGLYYFRTRPEAPFFGSKQFALRLRVEQPIKRKLSLLVKINSTLVAELELDELDDSRSLVFVLQNPHLIDYANLFSGRSSRAPDLWLMWRQRSFNLLLAHQASELHLNAIELALLDDNDDAEHSSQAAGNSTAGADGAMSPQRRPAASGANNYIIRYELNLANSNVKNNESGFLSRIQHNGARESGGGGGVGVFVVARNQWHKFDGRPVPSSSNAA